MLGLAQRSVALYQSYLLCSFSLSGDCAGTDR
jgi:hypothetical protein